MKFFNVELVASSANMNALATTVAPAGDVCVWSMGKYESTSVRPWFLNNEAVNSPWSTKVAPVAAAASWQYVTNRLALNTNVPVSQGLLGVAVEMMTLAPLAWKSLAAFTRYASYVSTVSVTPL